MGPEPKWLLFILLFPILFVLLMLLLGSPFTRFFREAPGMPPLKQQERPQGQTERRGQLDVKRWDASSV